MTPSIRQQLNEAIDKRQDAEREILYAYYKRAKYMCNEDARQAVASHFTWFHQDVYDNIWEATKHWNDLNNER